MSLNSLAASRVARDLPAKTSSAAFRSVSEDTIGFETQDVQNALSSLVEYIPTETIALYLAAISSLPSVAGVVPGLNATSVYWTLAVLTPILFALVYAGKRLAAGENRWPGVKLWPWWPMIAATIAFLAWGLSVPGGPYLASKGGSVLGALIAIFASTLLGVVGRFFGPRPK